MSHPNDEIIESAQVLFDYHCVAQEPESADAIIGLGSYDLTVPTYCVYLLESDVARFVLFSGNVGNWTDGVFMRPEAVIFKEFAISKGIPENKIATEEKATNLGENVRLSIPIIAASGWKDLIWVTKPQTTRRVRATLRMHWPESRSQICAPAVSRNYIRENEDSRRLINEMVGDLARCVIYPKMGYQVEEPVPTAVFRAARALAADIAFRLDIFGKLLHVAGRADDHAHRDFDAEDFFQQGRERQRRK